MLVLVQGLVLVALVQCLGLAKDYWGYVRFEGACWYLLLLAVACSCWCLLVWRLVLAASCLMLGEMMVAGAGGWLAGADACYL